MFPIFRSIFFLVIPFLVFAQNKECEKSKDKKAIKLYEQAMKVNNSEEKKELLKSIIEMDPNFVDAYYDLAYLNIKKQFVKGNTIPYLLKVIELCPEFNSYVYYYLGDIYFGNENYSESLKYLEEFLKDVDKIKTDADYNRAAKMLKEAKVLSELLADSVPFEPKLVEGISTSEDEVLPIISPDNELVFYTRRVIEKSTQKNAWSETNQNIIEKFILSRLANGKFDTGNPMPPPFNLNNNEGGATISIDNKHLFFTVCKPDGTGYNNCDIYYSDFINGSWSEIKNLGSNVNGAKTWEVQPSIASDGKTLYFVSLRESNIGFSKDNPSSDIYKTIKNPDGEWGKPINLGPIVNTSGNEKSPFIHSDSETLYFSSDGQIGIGGYDIFFTKGDEQGVWRTPKNIGYPINTKADELSFFVSSDGRTAYFASNKLGNGGWDLYSFELYPEARPEKILFLKGQLKDENGDPLIGAKVKIKSTVTNEVTEIPVDSTDGAYVAVVKVKKEEDFVMTVNKEGYAFNSQYISTKDSVYQSPAKLDFEQSLIEVGKAYKLNNILFATNSFELSDMSKIIIDEFIEFLRINSKIKISIDGHTDNVGDKKDNLTLSENRARAVYEYIVARGIGKNRLSYKGYGENKPIASNNTEEGRARNRRTEFLITAK